MSIDYTSFSSLTLLDRSRNVWLMNFTNPEDLIEQAQEYEEAAKKLRDAAAILLKFNRQVVKEIKTNVSDPASGASGLRVHRPISARDAIIQALKISRSLHIDEIIKAVQAQGADVQKSSLMSMLSRGKDTFKKGDRRGYWMLVNP